MTLSEVEILMQELGRHIDDHTQILFGTSVDGRMGNRLSVTLISSLAAEEEVAPPPPKPASRAKPEPVVEARARGASRSADLGTTRRASPVARAEPNLAVADRIDSSRKNLPSRSTPEPAPIASRAGGAGHRRSAAAAAARDSAQKEAGSAQGTETGRGEKACRRNRKCCNSSRSRAVVLRKANRRLWKARISMSRRSCARTCG